MSVDTQPGLVLLLSISPDTAEQMVKVAKEKAEELSLKKIAIGVMGMERFLLASASGGGVTPNNVDTVERKLDTVMNTRRSIHVQKAYMEREKIRPSNYGLSIRTLFDGGLAVFADPELTQFVGAIAASGGSGWEDARCCVAGLESVGLFTDEIDSLAN